MSSSRCRWSHRQVGFNWAPLRCRMLARACVLLLALVQSFFALMLVAGHSRFSGHVLVTVSRTHGLDSGDLPVIVLWLVAMACCAVVWWRAKPPEPHEPAHSAQVPKTVRWP